MLSRLAAVILTPLLLLQPASAQQTDTTIRSTTRLVQVSVVVLDNHGNPITSLSKNDFSVTDEGHPQVISVFTAETPASAAPPAMPLPANTFTNRFDLKGQDPGAVTIILFDALNTAFADQSLARKQILKFLKTLAPQDHVAIYALDNTKLYILHDFTSDSAALVNAVNHFSPDQTIAFEASNPGFIDLVGMTGNPDWGARGQNIGSFQSSLNNANEVIADVATFNRVNTTNEALTAICNHVESVPGRKSLVWIPGGFPLQIELGHIGNVERNTYSAEDIFRTSLALNRANISIYPIDVHGVEIDSGVDPSMRGPGRARGIDTPPPHPLAAIFPTPHYRPRRQLRRPRLGCHSLLRAVARDPSPIQATYLRLGLTAPSAIPSFTAALFQLPQLPGCGGTGLPDQPTLLTRSIPPAKNGPETRAAVS